MPDIYHTLNNQDLGFLDIIAERWGLELEERGFSAALDELVNGIKNHPSSHEVLESLPEHARQALGFLMSRGGKETWSKFVQKYGDLRVMGPARRDREKPQQNPESVTEILYYHGLIGKAFLNRGNAVLEFAYIPDEFQMMLDPGMKRNEPIGRAAVPRETLPVTLASDRIVDEAVLYLAAARIGFDHTETALKTLQIPEKFLVDILQEEELLNKKGEPIPEALPQFLESSRVNVLKELAVSWSESKNFNDLRHVNGLVFEGDWQNDPFSARKQILEWTSSIRPGVWWHISGFVNSIKAQFSDFQRPPDDYDSWFIRDERSGDYLKGFENWDRVDGALIRWIITGPLFWFGAVDLGGGSSSHVQAFRLTNRYKWLFEDAPLPAPDSEIDKVKVASTARIQLSFQVPRAIRYRISRFCYWEGMQHDVQLLRITPDSLSRAANDGLKTVQLISLLEKNSAGPLPPAFTKAMKAWDEKSSQADIAPALVLRVTSPAVLEKLFKSKARRFIKEQLGPNVVSIQPGSESSIQDVLAELGCLTDVL